MAIRVAKVRVELVKERYLSCDVKELSSPEIAAEFARNLYYEQVGEKLRCPSKEIIIVCSLNKRLKPLAVEYVSIGTSSNAVVDMKSIFLTAILSNAEYIFCFHNHPSGNPKPSKADELLTSKIREAGNILDIHLLDHIIIGDEGFYSCNEKIYKTKG